jgi:hypothetical protein
LHAYQDTLTGAPEPLNCWVYGPMLGIPPKHVDGMLGTRWDLSLHLDGVMYHIILAPVDELEIENAWPSSNWSNSVTRSFFIISLSECRRNVVGPI